MSTLDPFVQGDQFDPTSVVWVWSLAEVKKVLDGIDKASEIVVDLETTGLNEHATGRDPAWPASARISMASFTLPLAASPDDSRPLTYVVPLSHPEGALRGHWREVLTILAKAMSDSGLPITNQNLKYDLRWIFAATTGIDLTDQFAWDTQISSHLLDETTSTSLKERAPATFGVKRWDDHDLSTPAASERVPLIELGLYAARDTYWTWRLAVAHRTLMAVGAEGEGLDEPEDAEEVENRRLGQLAVWCAMPTSATLTGIEQRGFALDTGWVEEERDRLRAISEEFRSRMVDLYEMDNVRDPSFAPTSLWFGQWAEAAVDAGDLRVAALTPTGKAQWGKSVLMRQSREGSEVAEHLLAYRQAIKRIEYLDSWLGQVTPEGLIHTTYRAGRVVTGRLSSADPNVQQITASLKPAFVPRPGFFIADLDYSQIELRGAAFIARCRPMLEAFREGLDLHLITAGRTNSEKALRAANLRLMQLGLPANGTGAEVLWAMRGGAPARVIAETVLRLSRDLGPDQATGDRKRWAAERGVQSQLEGRDLAATMAQAPDGLLRTLRSDFERWGWPWEWDADDARRSSSGLGSREQSGLELDDALQVVSQASASELAGVTGDPWGTYRQAGKAAGFGLVYGMSAQGFRDYAETSYGVVLSEEEAVNTRTAFFDQWQGLAQWHERAVRRARQTGQIVSPIGRMRRVPGIFDGNPSVASHAERQAINSPVQGFASDLMQIAAASIEGNLPGYDPVPEVRLIGTVHDSIVAEVPIDGWQRATGRMMRRMLDLDPVLARMGCHLDVPLAVEATIGTRWGLSDVGVIK